MTDAYFLLHSYFMWTFSRNVQSGVVKTELTVSLMSMFMFKGWLLFSVGSSCNVLWKAKLVLKLNYHSSFSNKPSRWSVCHISFRRGKSSRHLFKIAIKPAAQNNSISVFATQGLIQLKELNLLVLHRHDILRYKMWQ